MHASKKSKVILKARNLSLDFQTQAYKFRSLRDVIAEMARDPWGALINPAEKVPILKKLNFEIHKGDRIALIGVNGVGKTTLCRVLAGLYRPNDGHVEKFGHRVRAVFDTSIGIQPELTGRENANLLLKFMYPELHEEHDAILEDVCQFSDLKEYLNVPFRDYSNGMQARLCLSLISAKPADLLILDEVFDGADQFFRKKIATRVQNIIANSGAVLFVSHSEDQVLQICNRAWYLKDGEIFYDGEPKKALDLYRQFGSEQGPGGKFNF